MAEHRIERARRFRDYAREDLVNNRFDSAAFFAQQSAELLLKGELIRFTGSRPITLSLSELLNYLSRVLGREVPSEVIRCAESLEQHYVQAKYPDARINNYRRWEAEEAVKCIEVIWDYVQQVVGGT
ncbi:HEPN domain-containing protein [Vulcanisaeta thermophila]|uniref:HEPN domain-containing protein n=1 Tax=Vulcanisaeta thermophila TaxID=867917 RepID=UPI000853C595|nr:HEPN domain-containing protein [Vulcanisaeta thermophila]